MRASCGAPRVDAEEEEEEEEMRVVGRMWGCERVEDYAREERRGGNFRSFHRLASVCENVTTP